MDGKGLTSGTRRLHDIMSDYQPELSEGFVLFSSRTIYLLAYACLCFQALCFYDSVARGNVLEMTESMSLANGPRARAMHA